MKKVFIIILMLFSNVNVFAQKYGQQLIDSLQGELSKIKEDSNKVKLLLHISDCYYFNLDSGLNYAKEAESLSKKLNWEKGILLANINFGGCYYMASDFAKGLEYYFKSLKICEEDGDKENEKNVLIQIAQLYGTRGDGVKSLEYSEKYLELEEATRDDNNISAGLFAVAQCYRHVPDYPKALEYFFKSLAIYKKLGDKNRIEYAGKCIAECYYNQGNYARALEYDSISLKMSTESHDIRNTKMILLDVGNIYRRLGKDSIALEYYNRIVKIDEDAGDTKLATSDYYPLIDVYLHSHNYSKALEYGFKILKKCEQADTANTKYALGEIGKIYFILAKDSATQIKADQLIPYGKKANLVKARDYFLLSGIRPTLILFFQDGSTTETANYYPQLIEAQKLLGDYKGAFENLEIAKALDDTASSKIQQGLVSSMEVTHAANELEKQMAVDQVAKIKKRNERIFFFIGIGLLLLVVIVIYRNFLAQKKSNKIITKEKKRSDDLLLNILPSEVAEELKEKGSAAARYFDHVTVLFTDFVGFTKAGERMSPQQLVDELDVCFKGFDRIIEKYGIEKIKTIGDAYLAVSGLPAEDAHHAENIVNAALDIRDFMLQRKQQHGDTTFEVRIGIHSGSVVAGIVGVKKFAYDIWGDTVNTAARMEQNSEGGKVNISQATYSLVKDQFACTYRGDIAAKNKGEMSMYFVEKINKV
jgi:class 3 adenylate cyclase